jgi:hypothetical protein
MAYRVEEGLGGLEALTGFPCERSQIQNQPHPLPTFHYDFLHLWQNQNCVNFRYTGAPALVHIPSTGHHHYFHYYSIIRNKMKILSCGCFCLKCGFLPSPLTGGQRPTRSKDHTWTQGCINQPAVTQFR